jgi:hypothetical protein
MTFLETDRLEVMARQPADADQAGEPAAVVEPAGGRPEMRDHGRSDLVASDLAAREKRMPDAGDNPWTAPVQP